MTDAVAIALIAATPPTLAACGALLLGFLNFRRGRKNTTALQEVKDSVQKVEIVIDGRLTELLRVTGTAKRAEGMADGVSQERTERRERDAANSDKPDPLTWRGPTT